MRAMYRTNHDVWHFAQNSMCVNSTTFHMFNRYITIKEGYFHFGKYAKTCKSSHMSFCAFPSLHRNNHTSSWQYQQSSWFVWRSIICHFDTHANLHILTHLPICAKCACWHPPDFHNKYLRGNILAHRSHTHLSWVLCATHPDYYNCVWYSYWCLIAHFRRYAFLHVWGPLDPTCTYLDPNQGFENM